MAGYPSICHHGAVEGVTGSCHELRLSDDAGILIDCGLFQGDEAKPKKGGFSRLEIEFPIDHIRALVVTHVHIDHVGRIPYLLAAGFKGPIICSAPSAVLLPLVLEDALEVGFTRDRRLIRRVLELLRRRVVGLPYGVWRDVELQDDSSSGGELAVRLQPAGHILGSAYVQCRVRRETDERTVIFSGDLGAPWTPLLRAPRSPGGADVVVLESTYGDRRHADRRRRRQRLRAVIERALGNGGTVLIPAFSIGRTQELLYELEDIIHRQSRIGGRGTLWRDLEIVVDSPLASRFNEAYRQLRPWWDAEARRRIGEGRHPLSFEQLTTVAGHQDHLRAVRRLARTGRPCVVLAASGMCSGGRIVNYLKAMISNPRHDILFVGYQARGTLGRVIQKHGPRGGWIELDGRRYPIRARVHTVGGYSAHAGQRDLVDFIRHMRHTPCQVRLIHGDETAKATLRRELEALERGIEVVIPDCITDAAQV